MLIVGMAKWLIITGMGVTCDEPGVDSAQMHVWSNYAKVFRYKLKVT